MNEDRLTIEQTIDLLSSLRARGTPYSFYEAKQSIVFTGQEGNAFELSLPLVFPKISDGTITDILRKIDSFTLSYTIVLVQAGAAALGHWEREELKHHKIIKKYMVRKKQGKAQIKHLASKGKSRLGSRIRLQNSVKFFEEINETLTQWDISSTSETILMSLPISLKNLLFTSKIETPFEKKDPRIKKVPIDVRVPSYKELLHVNWIAGRAILRPVSPA